MLGRLGCVATCDICPTLASAVGGLVSALPAGLQAPALSKKRNMKFMGSAQHEQEFEHDELWKVACLPHAALHVLLCLSLHQGFKV